MSLRFGRPLVLAGLAATALAATALAPGSSAASDPKSVKGGLVQSYQATAYVKPVPPKIPKVRFYLAGTSQDQLNKVQGAPTATFSKTRPTAAQDIRQETSPVVGAATAGSDDAASAYWSAPYTGRIKGKVTITWFWSSVDAAASDGNLIAHLWADPGTPQQKELGSAVTGVPTADGTARAYTVTIEVDGLVRKELRLQGTPRYVDTGQGLTAHYGSADAPGFFEIPLATAPVKLPTTKALKVRDPLVISATRIGRKAAEPTIGLTRQGNAFFAASDFDGLSPANPRTLIYRSTDGNRTWANVTPLYAGQPIPPTTLDPYVYVDEETGRVFSDDLTVACSFLTWSDDQGATWNAGNPLACEAPVDDHQTLAVGNPPPGITTRGYPNVVYYCVNKVADAQCARSDDGGLTFQPSGAPAFQGYETPTEANGGASGLCGGLHGHVVVDPAGRVLLPKGHCDIPTLAISEDGGRSWTRHVVSRVKAASHQTSVASDSKGNLYYLWIGKDDLLPYLAVSKNNGRSWSQAMLVAPPGVAAVNFPTIDALGPGHVAISFPGTTERLAGPGRPWNYYVAVSTDALAPRPTFHSATANPAKDPIHRGACLDRCAGMFDFIDVVLAPSTGAAWAAATDTCTSVKCIEATRTTAGPGASDAQGVAVRQLSGPGLRRR